MDELFQLALQALHRGMSPAEVDALIAEDTQGKIASLDALKTHLRQQDMSGQGTAIEAFGGGAMPFLDRIGGALDALASLQNPQTGVEGAKHAYEQGRDVARLRNEAYASEHPTANLAARITGGVGGAIAGSAALKALGFLGTATETAPTVGQLARTGAAGGAIMGGLQGLSDTPDLTDLPEALGGAAKGAAGGAAAGAVFGAATKPVAALARNAAPWIRGVLPDFIPGSISASEAGATRAAGRLATVLPESAPGTIARLEAARPGAPILADADRGVTLDAALRRAPGRAEGVQGALAARSNAGGPALAAQVEQAAGVPGANAVEAQAAIQASRPAFREATYKLLEEAHPTVIRTPLLDEALALPEVAAVVPDAPSPGMPDVAPLSFQRLQTALRTLRQRQESLFRGATVGDPIPVKEAADALERGMEESMPMFRAANRGWAESAQALEAFDAGRKALGKDARVIAQELADYGPEIRSDGRPNTVAQEARNAYRLAALDEYASRLRNLAPGRNAGTRAVQRGDQMLESRLRTLFGNTAEMDRFFQSAQAEQWLKSTQNALSGSKTQGRTALDESLFGPRTTGGRLWRKLANWVQKDAGSAADEALGNQYVDLLTGDPQRGLGLIGDARARTAAANAALPGQALGAGLFGGTDEGKTGAAAAGLGALYAGPRSIRRMIGWDSGQE